MRVSYKRNFSRNRRLLRLDAWREPIPDSPEDPPSDFRCPDELSLPWLQMLVTGRSPLAEMHDAFEGDFPEFDPSFINACLEYFDENGEDSVDLLESLVHSNAARLTQFSVFARVFPHVPGTFPIISNLISRGGEQSVQHFIVQGGISLLGQFASVPEFQLSISLIWRLVSQTYLDFGLTLLPPIDWESDEDIEFGTIFERLLASDNLEVIQNTLSALTNCLSRSSEASEMFGPAFLDHFRDFVLNDDLRVVSLSALCRLQIEIPDPPGLVDFLKPLLSEPGDSHTKQVLLFYEEIADRYGIEPFGEEVVCQIVGLKDVAIYSVKVDLMYTLAKMIERGARDFHQFLVANGVMELFDDFATVPNSNEMRKIMLEALHCLADLDEENLVLGDELMAFVVGATEDPDERIASTAQALRDRLAEAAPQ
jgi:hypothetical protein